MSVLLQQSAEQNNALACQTFWLLSKKPVSFKVSNEQSILEAERT